jgi:serine/threonine protein kinase
MLTSTPSTTLLARTMQPLLIGETIGRYRALAEVGAGGMGVVYRAEDLVLRREVALKVLTPTVAPDAVDRFLQEARAAASLNHPNICTIYDAGEFEGRPYIAMELLDGQTLKDRLAAGLPSLLYALDVAVQTADGLSAAHAKGIVHRDIKPANIAVTDDWRVKILDFGLAKLVPEIEGSSDPEATQLTGHATVLGTTSYMSPEQMRGEPLDARTDLFSFGIVLYEMCTGRRPFTGSNSAVIANAVLSHDPPPLQSATWSLPSELGRIVRRTLEKSRERRYQRATELLADLRALKRRLDTEQVVEESTRLSGVTEGRHDTSRLGKVAGPSGVPEALRDYLRRFPDADVQLRRLKHYVWPSASIEDQVSGHVTRTGLAQEILMTTLRDDPEALVLLLGDYGTGKTSFLQMLGRELATDALMEAGDTPFPLYLNLGFARNTADLLGALSAYLARYAVAVSPTELRDFILTYRNVVLLLDGFDEMAGWVDFGAVPEILERIRHLQSTSGVRIVLSGRTSFFRSDIEVGIVGASHVVRLRPFDDETILNYVSLRDPKLVPRATALFDRYQDLRELCRHPLHLMLFVNWLAADVSSAHAPSESGQRRADAASGVFDDISVVDLYHRFFSKTLQDNFGTLTKWPLNERWTFVRRVAWDWFNDNIFEWPIQEFSKRIAAEFPNLSKDEVDRYTLQLLNCTFFTRVGDRYRFLHRSYIEYLVSQILCDALWSGELKPWESVLYTDIFEMTYQLLKKRGLDQLDFDRIIDGANLRAQSNILTMSWRHRPPSIEPVVRKQLRFGKFDILRLQSAMGMALYEPTRENVECVVEAFHAEQNSVVKATTQRAASNWLASTEDPELREKLRTVVDSAITLETADAERATLQRKDNPKDSERILLAYRRAMLQGDRLWPASAGPMIALGVVRHASSFSYIHRVASTARHPEIRAAYKLVQPFTRLPDLPPL